MGTISSSLSSALVLALVVAFTAVEAVATSWWALLTTELVPLVVVGGAVLSGWWKVMLAPFFVLGALIVSAEAPLVAEGSLSPSGCPSEEEEEEEDEEEVSGRSKVGAASTGILAASAVAAAVAPDSSSAFSAPDAGGGDEVSGLLRSLKPSAERVQPFTWLEILVGWMPRARAAAACEWNSAITVTPSSSSCCTICKKKKRGEGHPQTRKHTIRRAIRVLEVCIMRS